MEELQYVLIAIIIVAMYLNITATVALVKAVSLSGFQKTAQGIIVWVVPFFGAWLVLYLLADHDPEAVPSRMIGSRGVAWYLIAGTYDGRLRGSDSAAGGDCAGLGGGSDPGGGSGGGEA